MPAGDPPSRVGRLLYGGVLAYMAVDGFRNNETRVDVARSRGVPLPEVLVPAATALLLVANLGPGARRTVPAGLAVYGRGGRRCRRCGDTIARAVTPADGRVTYWCPGCQRLLE